MAVLKQQKSFVFSYESNFGFSAANVFICGSVQIFQTSPKMNSEWMLLDFPSKNMLASWKKSFFFHFSFALRLNSASIMQKSFNVFVHRITIAFWCCHLSINRGYKVSQAHLWR